jgi:hypothetical protein
MRASCLAMAAMFLLAGCGQVGSSIPSPRSIDPASRFAAPAGGAMFFVDGVRGNNENDCRSPQRACKTIQHAVNISGKGDTINVAAAVYRENLSVHHSVHIDGAGSGRTIVDGQKRGSAITVAFNQNADVTIQNLTARNGVGSPDGGGIYHCFGTMTINGVVLEGNSVPASQADGYGGAMYNCPSSVMTIVNSTFRDNVANVGGGICNGGLLTIFYSTFSGNTTRKDKGGGAIFNYGVLHVADSTFSGNTAPGGVGGAIDDGVAFGGSGGAQIDNNTISGNSAGGKTSAGGGIYNNVGLPVYVQNTIIANNAPQNCAGARLETEGFNLSGDKSCNLHGAGDQNGVDPMLGPLQYNGGPTFTMALLAGSPAIDGGNASGCRDWLGRKLTTDQRGMPRPDPQEPRGCDIGAYESQ